jgi:hypothetical protein
MSEATERAAFERIWAERQGSDLSPLAFTRDGGDPEEYADTAACFAWIGFRLARHAAVSAPLVPSKEKLLEMWKEAVSRAFDEEHGEAHEFFARALLAAQPQQPESVHVTAPGPSEGVLSAQPGLGYGSISSCGCHSSGTYGGSHYEYKCEAHRAACAGAAEDESVSDVALMSEVIRMRDALDAIYRHNEAARAAVVLHYGTTHAPVIFELRARLEGNTK